MKQLFLYYKIELIIMNTRLFRVEKNVPFRKIVHDSAKNK